MLTLSDPVRGEIVSAKATCPFIGPAIASGKLPVRGSADNPLASIEDVRKLGNSGDGSDLGEVLLTFATGNHAFMRGAADKLDARTPNGLFSLEFPGSQGSHPGHSGILQGDPKTLASGRFSQADFERLTSRATNGFIKRSDVARFIAENLIRDPNSKVFGPNAALALARDLGDFVLTAGPAFLGRLLGRPDEAQRTHRDLEEKLTRLLGEDNLVGSAGEFGLLFAFFANKPGAQTIGGEPAIAVTDLKAMFVDKRLPADWEQWKKRRVDWVTNTTALLVKAGAEYLALKLRNR